MGKYRENNKKLNKFWPNLGPQWDALGIISDEKENKSYILLEAKANIREIFSNKCEAKKKSLNTIKQSLKDTRKWLDCEENEANEGVWKNVLYQYANRLAHLYFFREKLEKETYMVFVYFTNNQDYIPISKDQWALTLEFQKKLMKLNKDTLKENHVVEIFIDGC